MSSLEDIKRSGPVQPFCGPVQAPPSQLPGGPCFSQEEGELDSRSGEQDGKRAPRKGGLILRGHASVQRVRAAEDVVSTPGPCPQLRRGRSQRRGSSMAM